MITLITIVIILIVISNITNENLMYMLDADGTPFSIFEGHGYAVYLIGVISLSFAIVFIWFTPFLIARKYQKKLQ